MPRAQEKNNSQTKANNAAAHAGASPGASVTTSDLLNAIGDLKTELKGDNESLRKDINSLRVEMGNKLDNITKDMQGLTERMDEAESRVGHVEDVTVNLTEALIMSIERQRTIQNKLTDLESRSRRNNIRLFGVGEGEEGKSVAQFITDLLKRELPLPAELDLKIQRAHRAPASKPPPDAPPRPIVVNFQEFTTKELVLKEAWKRGKIQVNNQNVYFDHDFATEIVKKRREYQTVKKCLKDSGIRFQTPYTNMRIHWEDGVRTYSSAHEARLELRRRGLNVETPTARKEEDAAETRLQEILGWQRNPQPQRARRSSTAQRAQEKLRVFQAGHTQLDGHSDSQERGAPPEEGDVTLDN